MADRGIWQARLWDLVDQGRALAPEIRTGLVPGQPESGHLIHVKGAVDLAAKSGLPGCQRH